MDTKALRQKVLDLAIRGKLVPQDPNDEPASVLLERIRAEKAQMVKEGKLKPKDIKNDTIIYVGDDNLHYEKFRDGTVKCIEDEIPFDMPDGWEWTRLAGIIDLFSGQDLTPDRYNDNGDGIPYITGASNLENGKVIINRWTTTPTTHAIPGDLLLTVKGSGVGKMAFSDIPDSHIARQIMALRCKTGIDKQYLHTVLSAIVADITAQANGIIPGIRREIVLTTLIPVPPCNEQITIGRQVQAAMSIIDTVEFNEADLNELIVKAKAKILNLAIRGQLIPQNESDEPAAILLGRIRAEKQSLVKKIKKDKKESVIFRGDDNSYYVNIDGEIINITDELPFEIPDTWAWSKLQDIFIVNPKNQLDDNLEVSFIPMPCINDGFSGTHTAETRKWKEIKKGFTHFREGDVVVAKITPCFENRKSAIMSGLINGYGAGTTELHVIRPYRNTILPEYILSVMKSNYFIDLGKQTFSGAVGQQRFSKEFFTGFYFPIPPIEEQKRIISQIRCLFSKLDMIEKALS